MLNRAEAMRVLMRRVLRLVCHWPYVAGREQRSRRLYVPDQVAAIVITMRDEKSARDQMGGRTDFSEYARNVRILAMVTIAEMAPVQASRRAKEAAVRAAARRAKRSMPDFVLH